MVRLLISLHRVVLVATIAIALVATGFGHRVPTAADEAALAFAVQNGVGLDEFCGGGGKAAHSGTDCQACQITASANLPPRAGSRVDIELAFHAAVVVPHKDRGAMRAVDPANRPQGPPVA